LHAARLLCLVGTTLLAVLSLSAGANAGACAGNDALGVSRVMEIDPTGGPRYGTYQYPSTLALGPKKVVLTFDDGPYPERTRSVLDALDRHCAKATFFAVGRFAEAYPDIVSDLVARGHTLANHSWSHPANLGHLALAKAKQEIERGFASLRAVSPGHVAPFFRYPGLNDSDDLNDYLAQSDIAVLSCDTGTDD
jgi:peptidoglycan/xylan/chitin deacetylase (PgdA/CDA1 family)